MNDEAQLQASMWVMIVTQTINAIDMPGHGPRKLPAPKVFVAIIVLWAIFGLIADMGQAKAAKIMAWTAVLVSLIGPALKKGQVLGPPNDSGGSSAGIALIGFLRTIAKNFGTSSTQSQGGQTSA